MVKPPKRILQAEQIKPAILHDIIEPAKLASYEKSTVYVDVPEDSTLPEISLGYPTAEYVQKFIRGYDSVFHLPDSINGQVSDVSIKGQSRTNLLTENQSSVETDLTGFDSKLSATLTRDTTEKLLGNSSLKVVTPGVQHREGFDTTNRPVTEEKTYAGSMYLKGSGELLFLIQYFAGGNFVGQKSKVVTLTNQWQRVFLSYACPTGATDVRLTARTNEYNTQAITFYADGLMIEETDALKEFIAGGDTKSTIIDSVESVNKNIYEGSPLTSGYYLDPNTGQPVASSNFAYTDDYARINNNQEYVVSHDSDGNLKRAVFYDDNKNIISAVDTTAISTGIESFTSPSRAVYVRFDFYLSGGVTILDVKMQIEQGSTATPYEPHKRTTKTIKDAQGNPITLRSLPNGVKDEISDKGVLTRRVGVDTRIKTATGWYSAYELTNTICFYKPFDNSDGEPHTNLNHVGYFDNLVLSPLTSVSSDDKEGLRRGSNDYIYIRVNKSRVSSLDSAGFEAWLQSLSSVTLIYQLAEEVVTDIAVEVKDQDGKILPDTVKENVNRPAKRVRQAK